MIPATPSSCKSSAGSDSGRFVPALTASHKSEQAQPRGTSFPVLRVQTGEESSLSKALAAKKQKLKPVETIVRMVNGARFVEQTGAVLEADGILPPCATSNARSDALDATKHDLKSASNIDAASAREKVPVHRRDADLPREIEVTTSWADLLDPNSGPTQCTQPDKREVYLIENVFSIAECKALIASSEQHGYGATNYPKSYRGNLRLITKDASLTGVMWQRLRPFIPATVTCGGNVWEAVGLNDCWRLAKYHPGDRFMRHLDAAFKRDQKEMSMFTVNIYMNGDFEGGATRFYPDGNSRDPDLTVSPEAGLCLFFRQPPSQQYHHDGEQVRQGNKYLFRTDIIYRLQDEHC